MLAESNRKSNNGDTPKLRAACENCRQSKVKCNLSGKDTCIRCLRHGLPCRYRVANRSGKPKGSKNRSTLRKLGQLQDERPTNRPGERVWADSMNASSQTMSPDPVYIHQDTEVNIEINSPLDPAQQQLSESPLSQASNPVASSMLFPESGTEYSSPFGDSFISDAPCAQASMSPTFLQKEFITKGLTSFPLAVHVPNALRPACDCGETLVFYLTRLRHMVANPAQVRFDQMLQGIQAALSVCCGFLQCPSGHNKGHTDLLLCTSTLDLSLQLFDYWMSYELLPPSARDLTMDINLTPINTMTVGYGEYEMGPDETRRIRRFLLRGRLLNCKDTLALLREATEMSAETGALGGGSDGVLEGSSSSWLHQIMAGSEAMMETFLQTLSDGTCICR